ncbi:hypothetical protein ACN9M1_26385 (plasmid) [Ralstonia sp. R-29]|uniref:hypothetical protein n=1 Tax=Ralstonia sp. R-29 TaxID=3404059 RepID=UPI003CF24F44
MLFGCGGGSDGTQGSSTMGAGTQSGTVGGATGATNRGNNGGQTGGGNTSGSTSTSTQQGDLLPPTGPEGI